MNMETRSRAEQIREELAEISEKYLDDVVRRGGMDVSSLEEELGAPLSELPYPVLQTLLPRGSTNPAVIEILKEKRLQHIGKPESVTYKVGKYGNVSSAD